MRRTWIFVLCLCLLSGLTGCVPSDADTPLKQLRIRFLDVGQGDCILISTEYGDVLIDAGPESSQEQLCAKLRRFGVTDLELAVFTHTDEDHIGGADGILREFPAKQIWINTVSDVQTESERLLWNAVDPSMTSVSEVCAGSLFLLGNLSLFVLAPMDGVLADSNDSGLVVKVTYGDVSALLMGDVGVGTEKLLLERYGASHLACSLLKVGHHGSSTSGGEDFLQAVNPEFAVISCASGNEYGHPHGDTLKRLRDVGANIFRTDCLGDIEFDCDGTRFLINESGG